jgi:calcineurin-like phosphoesterase family protein
MRIFIIADTHFGHARMTEYEGRPADFDERIAANWNALVAPEDVVLHLGDVAFGRGFDLAGLMARLNGRKILCLGNHDERPPLWYMERGFAFACRYFVLQGICFSHKPMVPLPPECELNVHGHFHRGSTGFEAPAADAYYRKHAKRYRLLQIEESFAPVLLEDLLNLRTAPEHL